MDLFKRFRTQTIMRKRGMEINHWWKNSIAAQTVSSYRVLHRPLGDSYLRNLPRSSKKYTQILAATNITGIQCVIAPTR